VRIGVFDSGLGGLTIVKSLQDIVKDATLYYIADTQNAPYGEKTSQQILAYSLQITEYLVNTYHIDALVVACNTATAFAIETLRQKYPNVLIVGTEPGVKPAMKETQSGHVGLLATKATLKGEKYQKLVKRLAEHCDDVTVHEQACIGLVEQIEAGHIEDAKTLTMLQSWLTPMRESGVDTIVLGCTHYPLVEKQIAGLMPNGTRLIHTGDAIAHRLLALWKKPFDNQNPLEVKLFATGEINMGMVESILNFSYDVKAITLKV
jgi:glutamate racemase